MKFPFSQHLLIFFLCLENISQVAWSLLLLGISYPMSPIFLKTSRILQAELISPSMWYHNIYYVLLWGHLPQPVLPEFIRCYIFILHALMLFSLLSRRLSLRLTLFDFKCPAFEIVQRSRISLINTNTARSKVVKRTLGTHIFFLVTKVKNSQKTYESLLLVFHSWCHRRRALCST